MSHSETLQTTDDWQLRWRTLLPETYRDRQDVQPVSMGSASLKYATDGKVAWDEIWGSFCDLAMAGGPPHRGTLLLPASSEEIDAEPVRYRSIVDEICRGIHMVTGLHAEQSPDPGWLRMYCTSVAMCGWLARAIVMENISVRCEGLALYLPAGPGYRVEKEIKNVVTSLAKTCHYWIEHMSDPQHQEVAAVLRAMEAQSPLMQPSYRYEKRKLFRFKLAAQGIATIILQTTGLQTVPARYTGWLGIECTEATLASKLVPILIASNVMARREGTVLFVPVHPDLDPHGEVVAGIFRDAYCLTIK